MQEGQDGSRSSGCKMVEAPGLCDCAELVKVGTRKTTGDIVGNEISGEGLGVLLDKSTPAGSREGMKLC